MDNSLHTQDSSSKNQWVLVAGITGVCIQWPVQSKDRLRIAMALPMYLHYQRLGTDVFVDVPRSFNLSLTTGNRWGCGCMQTVLVPLCLSSLCTCWASTAVYMPSQPQDSRCLSLKSSTHHCPSEEGLTDMLQMFAFVGKWEFRFLPAAGQCSLC